MRRLNAKDTWLGLSLLLGGIWSYYQSQGFDQTSRDYPMLLSGIISALGGLFIISAFRTHQIKGEEIGALLVRIRGPLLIVAMMCGWVSLLSVGLGYLFSSLLAVFLILAFIGDNNKSHNMGISALIVSAIFILFSVIFDVPLPSNLLAESILM